MSSEYQKSGVNIDEGNRFVEIIKTMVASTATKEVLGGLGGFAGFFDLSAFSIKEPVLVACTDGVGTKLRVAIDAEIYNTVGIDLVAMSVNDLIVTGARPLFFLDYVATAKLSAENMAEVVAGIVTGCKEAQVALIGGETAEMPGMYKAGDFDLAGFAVGIVNKPDIIDGSRIRPGDKLIGLASSGFHSNGYSLLRKIFFEDMGLSPNDHLPLYGSLGKLLLTPTRIYVKTVLGLLNKVDVHGMVHITGGGFYDNIPRVLPKEVSAVVRRESFPEPDAVKALRSIANIDEAELYRVFNMGIGYVIAVSSADADKTVAFAEECGERAFVIGEIIAGDKRVLIEGID